MTTSTSTSTMGAGTAERAPRADGGVHHGEQHGGAGAPGPCGDVEDEGPHGGEDAADDGQNGGA